MFAQRLKELRKLNGLSQAALSSLLGVTQQAVGKWETGRSTPDPQTLARVAAYFKVSTDYLLGCAPAPITSAVAAADGPREFPIPIIGTVRAGFGAFAFEEDYGEEYARVKDPGSYFYLLVKGDSMEPKFSEGDVVIVRRQPDVESGEIAVVLVNGDCATVKKIVKHANGISLVSSNAAYMPMFYTMQEIEDLPVEVLGKVIELRAKF